MLKNLLSRWRQLRVQSQLILLLVLAATLEQLVNVGIQLKIRAHQLDRERVENSFERIAAVADFVMGLPQEQRQTYLSSLNLGRERYLLESTPFVETRFSQQTQVEAFAPFVAQLSIQADNIRVFVGEVAEALECERSETLPEVLLPPQGHYSTQSHPCYSELIASIHIPSLGWLNVSHNLRRPPPIYFWQYWATNLFTLALSIGVIVFALRSFLQPLRRLQVAVQRSGHNIAPTLVEEQGAADIRNLIKEYNQMQQRISRFVENRTQLLAAISHDLRTPITSMRLRMDFLPESEDKAKLLETLEQLSATADASLNFVRETKSDEAFVQLDLLALVEACCEDFMEVGQPVEWQPQQETATKAICQGQPNALRRALNNMLQNAVNYGVKAEVSLIETPQAYRVQILDQGPGIPAEQQERVFEPFVRLENSRNQETGGAGLGLAITRSIADDHTGRVEFSHCEAGFMVSLVIPKG